MASAARAWNTIIAAMIIAAVASAVRDALGLTGGVERLPLTPPRVRRLAETCPRRKPGPP